MRLSAKLTVIIVLVSIVIVLIRCGGPTEKSAQVTKSPISAADDIAAGEKLAATYCQSCHQLPDPLVLNKRTWQRVVLPAMGLYLGVRHPVSDSLMNDQVSNLSFFPQSAVVDSVQWRQIMAYYISKAPERLPAPEQAEPTHELPIFKIIPAPAEWVSPKVLTSYVKIDESVKPHRLIVCDGMNNKVILLDAKGQTINTTQMSGAIVGMVFQKGKVVATSIGDDLWANHQKKGTVKELTFEKNGKIALQERTVIERLGRPVLTDIADLNGDGKPDYLVGQFGKILGRLSWFEEIGNGVKEHIIRDKPGVMRAIIENKTANIWALFAQGDEAIFQYTNDGKGNFKERRVLSFPPAYGSSYFDMVDFNGDGHKDIVYTCGDNGDYSQVPKPYHGVYIYINDGKDNFKQQYFYPIDGCYKAIVKDFDGDGDLDIATISQFPSPQKPWQSFLYLENKGMFNFKAYSLPLNIRFSSAITMDAGDVDGDGKADLLLGNGFVDPKGVDKQPLFIVLKNVGKR